MVVIPLPSKMQYFLEFINALIIIENNGIFNRSILMQVVFNKNTTKLFLFLYLSGLFFK